VRGSLGLDEKGKMGVHVEGPLKELYSEMDLWLKVVSIDRYYSLKGECRDF
jgi:hypothetical protein